MKSLFKAISRFFQRLFSRGTPRQVQGSVTPTPIAPAVRPASVPPASVLPASVPPASFPLRQLVFQATFHLSRQKRTHAAQVGALLRQKDRSFSYEKYNFTKLIDLLEAVPDLVEMEKTYPDPGNPNSAPVYYVRPVTETKRLLTGVLKNYADSADGWVHLESVREAIATQSPTFSVQRYGYDNFKAFITSRPDLIEVKTNSPDYVRLLIPQDSVKGRAKAITKPKSAASRTPNRTVNRKARLSPPPGTARSPSKAPLAPHTLSRSVKTIEPLAKFAGLSAEIMNQKVGELAAIALPERWYFGPVPPADFAYPILKSYLRYTFIRLQHEGKAIASPNHAYRAFNTGLVDTLLRPIYALFKKSNPTATQTWDLNFCIAGEGPVGKNLVAQFPELPLAANYLSDPEKAFYDLAAGAPQVDWQHVVKDNMARLPLAFMERYAPAGFIPCDTQGLTTTEFFDYKRSFIEALDADPGGYRNIVSKLEEALERTLRRTQINYTTAVPTYYPKINSIDLLLPMCLVDESRVDFAIVTRREPSGKYIGHTILTLRQAYNNARLICKLDGHWLPRAMALSQAAFDEDNDESAAFVAEDSNAADV